MSGLASVSSLSLIYPSVVEGSSSEMAFSREDPGIELPKKDEKKSYAAVLATGALGEGNCYLAGYKVIAPNFVNLYQGNRAAEEKVGVKKPGMVDGRPAIELSAEELDELAKPLQLTLIGKFPLGRPKWSVLSKFFHDLKLVGNFKLANLDFRHFVLHLQSMEDYIRIFSKQIFHITGFPVKFLKWNLDFDVNSEPPVAPVWILLPMIGLHLYTQPMLFSIGSIFGRPLRLDFATTHWTRPGFARILVEMDLRKDFSHEIWIGNKEKGYMQKVIFENLPAYCSSCRKLGHKDEMCFIKFPELKRIQKVKNKVSVSLQQMNGSTIDISSNPVLMDEGDNIDQQHEVFSDCGMVSEASGYVDNLISQQSNLNAVLEQSNSSEVLGKDLVESSLRHDDLLSIKTGEILHQSVAQFDNNSFHEASARQKDHLDVLISHQELQNNVIVSSQATVGNKEKPHIIVQPVQVQQILNNSGIDGFQNLVDKKGSEEIFNVNVDAVQNFECQTVSDYSEAQIVDGNLNTNVLNPVGDTANDINSAQQTVAVDDSIAQIVDGNLNMNVLNPVGDIAKDINSAVDKGLVQFIQNVLNIPFGYSEAIQDAPEKAINAAVNIISGKFPIMSNCPQGYVQLEKKGFSQNHLEHLDGVEKDVRLQHTENSVSEITDDISSQSANLNEDFVNAGMGKDQFVLATVEVIPEQENTNIDCTSMSKSRIKGRKSWADEVEEQDVGNFKSMMLVDLDDEDCTVIVSNQKGEQIFEAEDALQIHKFYLKGNTKSLGDEFDSEGEEGLYQILQVKGKLSGKETSFRSPIMTRSRTKAINDPGGYVSDSWYTVGRAF